jgi:hypothetical protein
MLNVSSTSSTTDQLEHLYSTTIDNSQDFTDSIYISIEQREKVLDYHRRLQDQLVEIVQIISTSNEVRFTSPLSISSRRRRS